MLNLLELKYSINEINDKRDLISGLIKEKSVNIKDKSIKIISSEELTILFNLYDEIFLKNWFKNNYKGKIKFSLSKRMTKSAGITICPKNIASTSEKNLVLEIKIGIDFFFHYNMITEPKLVCGIETKNSFHALQIVFEHEICHLIEFILFYESSCKKDRFKSMAYNLFKHTSSYHQLPTHKKIAMEQLGVSIGDIVSFSYREKIQEGILYKINKKAIVMVKDKKGSFMDKSGNKYMKYYVPLNKLKLIKK
ncbi:hypothetical protein [Clostridium grantii]|uniref:SprT-like family protein n=1 Tax=Clostridium grantii DSM 8605 TaxID=1121316 RepID=A0A1M5VQ60_9CLOT|nr:hypothetical protein [Clostridium grantii]SHH77389.1 hypothetical protein SAMN02745207_02435 [Clostridium grantii DSM 8605]